MGLFTGNYSRFMFDEEKQYLRSIVQQGIPWIDADENDGRQSTETQIRRLAQMIGCGSFGNGFKIAALDTPSATDFNVTGGDGTLDGAARIVVDGYTCLLKTTVNYGNTGGTIAKESIFPALTGIHYNSGTNTTVIEDSAANWVPDELIGRSIYPNVESAFSAVITDNTANTITVSGDATSGGAVTGSYYRLSIPTGSFGVYLNVFVDEVDATEDPNLEHQLATPIEAQRRAKLVHSLFVRGGDTNSFVGYVDLDGNKHYTYKLAQVTRSGSAVINNGTITDLRTSIGTALDCSAQKYDYTVFGGNNLLRNSDFSKGCFEYLSGAGLLPDKSWGLFGNAVTAFTIPSTPEKNGSIRIQSGVERSQLYQTLQLTKAVAGKYPITVSFDMYAVSRTTNYTYAEPSPESNYSCRLLISGYDTRVYNLNDADVPLNAWKRHTVTFPLIEDVGDVPDILPQLIFDLGPNAAVNITNVTLVIGEAYNLPYIPENNQPVPLVDTKVFYQDTPSNMWLVKHNLGIRVPIIHVWDSNGESLLERYGAIEFTDKNTLKITFDEDKSGKVVLTAIDCKTTSFYTGVSGGSNEYQIPNGEAYAISVTTDSSYNLVENEAQLNSLDREITVITSPSQTGLNHTISSNIDLVHNQITAAASWGITHSLNTTDLIVRCYDTTGTAIPGVLTITDPNTVMFTSTSAVSGYALIKAHKKPDSGMEESTHTVPVWRTAIQSSVTSSDVELVLFSEKDIDVLAKNTVTCPISGIADLKFTDGSNDFRFYATFQGNLYPAGASGRLTDIAATTYGGQISTVSIGGHSLDGVATIVVEDNVGYITQLPDGSGALIEAYLELKTVGSSKQVVFKVKCQGSWSHEQHAISAVLFGNHRPY